MSDPVLSAAVARAVLRAPAARTAPSSLHGFTGNPSSMRGVAEALAAAGLRRRAPAPARARHDGGGHARPPASPTGRRPPRRPTSSSPAGWPRWWWSACRWAPPWPPGWRPGTPDRRARGHQRHVRAAGPGLPRPAPHLARPGLRPPPRHRLRHRPPRRQRGRLRRRPHRAADLAHGGHHGAPRPPGRHPLPGARSSPRRRTTWCRRALRMSWPGRSAGPSSGSRLERSYHVATLDFDRDLVEKRTVEFALRVTVSR